MRTEHTDRILLVEDDAGICKFLKTTLTANGYDVIITKSGKEALDMIGSHCPDCILLDLGLPDMDGNSIIKSVRTWTKTPIVVISARSMDEDKAYALDLGADDYLTKPFGTIELLARIRTALRHTRTTQSDEIALNGYYQVGDLRVDYRKYRVYLNDRDTNLTPNEFKIVALLGKHAGQVLTYRYMLRELWGRRPARITRFCAFTWPISAARLNQTRTSRAISLPRSASATAWPKATPRINHRRQI
jgi:two-component system KDP operon response regulator KdpE